MKQRIADGVAQWLREDAPTGVTLMMDRKAFNDLVQAICNQFTRDDFVEATAIHHEHGAHGGSS